MSQPTPSKKQGKQPATQQKSPLSTSAVPAAYSYASRATNAPPSEGRVVVHEELFYPVVLSTAARYENSGPVSLSINPANPALFPWLSNCARQYDEYWFDSVTFHFSTIVGTTTNGAAVMSYDPDSTGTAPLSKVEATASKSASGPVYRELTLACGSSKVWKLCDNTGDHADLSTVDFGRLTLAFYGGASSISIGDVTVRYKVRFRSPQFAAPSNYLAGLDGRTGPAYAKERASNSSGIQSFSYTFQATGSYAVFLAVQATSVSTTSITLTGAVANNRTDINTSGSTRVYANASLTVTDLTNPTVLTVFVALASLVKYVVLISPLSSNQVALFLGDAP